MTDDIGDPATDAVEQLEYFGLSRYAAQTYVALSGLDSATAREVSEVSRVPRTRVYDAVNELEGRGLVDVQQSTPKRFRAVSSESAGRILEHDVRHRIEALRTALSEVTPPESRTEQRGVWTVSRSETITDRVHEFVREADEEVVYATLEDLLADDTLTRLGAVADRGVAVELGGVSESVRGRVTSAVPDATFLGTVWLLSETPVGRVLLVDRTRALVSVLPEDGVETAIWGSGEHNSLVVVLRALVTWQLDGH